MLSKHNTSHYMSPGNTIQNYVPLVGMRSASGISAFENKNAIMQANFNFQTNQPTLNWAQNSNDNGCVGNINRFGPVPILQAQRHYAQNRTATEKGVVTLLRSTYGFITPRYSNSCLFFHYNNVISEEAHPSFGDIVQYKRAFDQIAGKSNATNVIVLNRQKLVSEERVNGEVIRAPVIIGLNVQPGEICYNRRNVKSYVLEYFAESVENCGRLFVGDRVSFHFAANNSGTLCAHSIRLLTPSIVTFYQ